MYNEEQKRAFIESHTKSDNTMAKIIQIFTWFEPYEEKWGLDLSQQNAEELQPVVNAITGVRGKSTELVIIILKEYIKWCERNGYKFSNGIYDVKIDAIEKIKTQMVASPLHLQSVLNEFFDKVEEETVDITYRIFLWMAFAGLEDKDAIRVTKNCVDLKSLKIRFEGHSYNIYEEGLEDFVKACTLTDFKFIHPNYITRRNRAAGDIIMRGVRSSTVNLKTIRPVINKKFSAKDTEKIKGHQKSHVSYKRIYLSGVFYRAYEREQAGLPVDFSEFVAMSMERRVLARKKDYETSKTRTHNTIANAFEREYLADYERWKCAFIDDLDF